MPTNLYDQAAQAQFINTYAPIPFQEILQAGQARQQRYDVNKSAYDTMAEQAEALKYIPKTEDERYIKETVIPTIRELTDSYGGKDYGNPEVVNEINRKLRKNINKNLVSQIQESRSQWDVDQQNIAKLKATGKYAPYLEPDYIGYNTETSGIYNQMTPAALDYETPATNYFKDIRDSLLTQPDNQGKYYVGVGPSKIQDVATEGVQSYLQSPAGRQKIQEYRYRTGDMDTPDQEIAHKYLLEVGERYKRANLKYAPGYAMSGSGDTQEYPTLLDLTVDSITQPTEVTGMSWKDVKKSNTEYKAKKKELESSLRIATSRGQETIARGIENQLSELDDKYGTILYFENSIREAVSQPLQQELYNSSQAFRSDLEQIVKDPQAASKWENAYTSAIASEDMSKKENLTQAIRDKYIELYGTDEDYTKFDKPTTVGPKGTELSRTIFKHTSKLQDHADVIDKRAAEEWKAVRANGITETSTVLPIVETSTDFKNYPEWRELNTLIKSTLPSTAWNPTPITSAKLTSKEQSDLTELFTNPQEQGYSLDNLNLVSAGHDDKDGAYIYVNGTFVKKGKKGAEEVKTQGYKLRLTNPSQAKYIASTFARRGNIYEALKWEAPKIGINIDRGFKNNMHPDNIVETVQDAYGNNYDIRFKLQSNGAYNVVDSSGNPIDIDESGNPKPYYTKEEIKQKAYTIFGINAGIL